MFFFFFCFGLFCFVFHLMEFCSLYSKRFFISMLSLDAMLCSFSCMLFEHIQKSVCISIAARVAVCWYLQISKRIVLNMAKSRKEDTKEGRMKPVVFVDDIWYKHTCIYALYIILTLKM